MIFQSIIIRLAGAMFESGQETVLGAFFKQDPSEFGYLGDNQENIFLIISQLRTDDKPTIRSGS